MCIWLATVNKPPTSVAAVCRLFATHCRQRILGASAALRIRQLSGNWGCDLGGRHVTTAVHEQLIVCSCQHLSKARQCVRGVSAKSCLRIADTALWAGSASQQAARVHKGAAPA